MRGLLMVLPVLVLLALFTLPPCLLAAKGDAPSSAVEAGLLSVLGLGHRPQKVDRQQVVIPPVMLELYKKQTGHDLDTTSLPLPGSLTRSANTVRSFTHTESAIDSRFPRNDRFRLHFNVSSVPEEEKLTGAELRLTSLPVDLREAPHTQRVLVHDIVRQGIKGQSKPILRLVDTKIVDSSESVTLDILPASQRWRTEPQHNHGLLVVVESADGPNHPAGDQSHVRLRRSLEKEEDWLKRQPVLFLYADDGRNKEPTLEEMLTRRKRASSMAQGRKHKRKDGRDNCRRHPLYVDFADVGWNDWIVAPPGYDAYYCQGDCPFPMADHLNSTNHAIVQTLVNSVNPSAVPKACCVPTALSSISMLYLDEENKVVLKNYQDMAVLGCGCR